MSASAETPRPDVLIRREGYTMFTFDPLSEEVSAWFDDNLAPGAQWHGSLLCVDHRYARDLADALVAAGFEVA